MIVKSMGYAPDAKIAIYPKQPVVYSISFLQPLDCSLKYLLTWDLSSNTVNTVAP
jgi:CHASE1-domain containing sensor protein